MVAAGSSWQLTDQERRKAVSAFVTMASSPCTTASMLPHMLSCPSRPKPPPPSELPFYCDRCGARFHTRSQGDVHFTAMHPWVSWWRSL